MIYNNYSANINKRYQRASRNDSTTNNSAPIDHERKREKKRERKLQHIFATPSVLSPRSSSSSPVIFSFVDVKYFYIYIEQRFFPHSFLPLLFFHNAFPIVSRGWLFPRALSSFLLQHCCCCCSCHFFPTRRSLFHHQQHKYGFEEWKFVLMKRLSTSKSTNNSFICLAFARSRASYRTRIPLLHSHLYFVVRLRIYNRKKNRERVNFFLFVSIFFIRPCRTYTQQCLSYLANKVIK